MTAERVVIAVTPWLRILPTALGERTTLYTLDPAYTERVASAGGYPTIVPHGADPVGALADVHGLLLSGGSDVHPHTYGLTVDGAEDDASPTVDEWELALLAEARRRNLPTFGVCRGAQLLAVAHGGRLVQHLVHGEHPAAGSLPPSETLERRHEVALEAGSRIASVLGTTAVQVNTIHHQAIADPGSLQISGTGPGEVIEAVEAHDWPAYGVQWHPEKMHEPQQRSLFEHLVQEARSRISKTSR